MGLRVDNVNGVTCYPLSCVGGANFIKLTEGVGSEKFFKCNLERIKIKESLKMLRYKRHVKV